MSSGIKISSHPTCVNIYKYGYGYSISSASASYIPGEDYWFINRVLVKPENERGKGIGSELLQLLIKEIKKHGGKKIIVTPGGYDNKTKKQFNFYRKNGFKKDIDCLSMTV